MNWLAHAFLSVPDREIRLGNLTADLVKGNDRARMSASFLEGVRRHQVIDSFTDSHPLVHRSRARLVGGEFRHATGIIVDIFYDHFLASDWERYSRESLPAFTSHLYAEIRSHVSLFPDDVRPVLERLMSEDWLGSYRHLEGIETALRRVSRRLSLRTGRDFELDKAIAVLKSHFDDFHGDFVEFFPQLQKKVSSIEESRQFSLKATSDSDSE